LPEVEEGSLKSFQVEFRAQSEVVKRGRILKEFEFDRTTKGSEKMIGLCCDSFGWGFFKRSIFFQRLMVKLHIPSFLTESGDIMTG